MATRTQAPSGRTNRQTNRRVTHTDPYMYGAAVPRLRPQAAPRPEHRPGRSAGSQSARHSRRTRRNQKRALCMDLPYVTMFTIASMSTLYLYINYPHVQSSITARIHSVERMEAQLEQLRAENDALETSINASIDLNEIYEIATKELGMVYAKKSRVLLYGRTESEYVRQYEDIPER